SSPSAHAHPALHSFPTRRSSDLPHYPQGIQQALEAGGLEATDQQYQEFLGIETQFFNKHYEFYGRQIKSIYWAQDCTDPACWRRSEEHTSELQSRGHLVCRLLLE